MAADSVVLIPQHVHEVIARWSEGAYPNEGVGLLIGTFNPGGKKVVARFAPLKNILLSQNVQNAPTLPQERQGTGAGKKEFLMDPAEFNQQTLAAEKEGLDVVGIVHTHPNHPPRPSAVDASQPFLAQWSNIIVAVDNAKFREMKSWFRETDDEPFAEESIQISK